MDEWAAIDAERAALADVLARISVEQWDAQSLCDAWKVRDVVAHLIDAYSEVSRDGSEPVEVA